MIAFACWHCECLWVLTGVTSLFDLATKPFWHKASSPLIDRDALDGISFRQDAGKSDPSYSTPTTKSLSRREPANSVNLDDPCLVLPLLGLIVSHDVIANEWMQKNVKRAGKIGLFSFGLVVFIPNEEFMMKIFFFSFFFPIQFVFKRRNSSLLRLLKR